jgi:hypothetical protein
MPEKESKISGETVPLRKKCYFFPLYLTESFNGLNNVPFPSVLSELNAVSDRADEVSALSKIVHEFKGTAMSPTDLML